MLRPVLERPGGSSDGKPVGLMVLVNSVSTCPLLSPWRGGKHVRQMHHIAGQCHGKACNGADRAVMRLRQNRADRMQHGG